MWYDGNMSKQTKAIWYESNLFWAPLCIGIAIITTVVSVMKYDIRLLFIPAWFFCTWAFFFMVKRRNLNKLFYLIFMVLIASFLIGLSWWLGQPSKPPTQEDLNETIKKSLITREASPDMTFILPKGKLIPIRKLTKKEVEQNIILYERYPQSWPKTNLIETESILLSDGKILRAVFRDKDVYNLGLTIFNFNVGLPLAEPRIVIKLPLNINVKPSTAWRYNNHANYRDYHIGIPTSVIYPVGQGAPELLALEFPKAGLYRIDYIITGTMPSPYNGIDIQGSFNIELIEENK